MELRDYVTTKSPAAPLFRMPCKSNVAEMLRADLTDAGIAYEDKEGRKLDFNALRYTTGAWLAMAGVHPKKIQRVMRHSTITLTMDTYADILPGEDADTIDCFPNLNATDSEDNRATGTGDMATHDRRLALCLAQPGESGQIEADLHGWKGPENVGLVNPCESSSNAIKSGGFRPSGRVPERTKGADCKSVGVSHRGFESHRGLDSLSEFRVKAKRGSESSQVVVSAGHLAERDDYFAIGLP